MEEQKTILEGVVMSGFGKGAVFMSIEYYKGKIKENLDFVPYPGTLNLKIHKGQANLLKETKSIRIEGFKKDNKMYGGASCYRVRLNDFEGAIIVPDLTEHEEDMIEVVAPINLKSRLKIKDGDKVKIDIM